MGMHAESRRSSTIVRRSSLLAYCSEPGCTTLTMGGTCVAHDAPDPPAYPSGAPFADVQKQFVRETQREVRSRGSGV